MAITDLTNTKWIVGTTITATAGYGNFSINTNFTYTVNGNTYNRTSNGLRIGYYDSSGDGNWSSRSDIVYLTYSDMPDLKLGIYETTIEITGGTDVKNASLISWITSNATQIIEPTVQIINPQMYILPPTKVIGNDLVVSAEEVVVNEALISFTIGSTTYQAEDGMTWYEWCNSDYNTSTYSCGGEAYGVYSGNSYIKNGSNAVKGSDIIINNGTYTATSNSPGGSN